MKRCVIAVLLTSLSAGCSFFPNHQTPLSVRNPLIDGVLTGEDGKSTTFKDEKARDWVNAYKNVKGKANPSQTDLERYVGSGFVYSRIICRDYFERLSYTKAHRDYMQKEANLTGGLVASLMGLAEASSGVIAGTSAAFSFGSASFDAYNESYLVSINIHELESLVRKQQKQHEALVYRQLYEPEGVWPAKIQTLAQADMALDDYIVICTPNGIRSSLNAAIEEKAKTTEAATKKIQQR